MERAPLSVEWLLEAREERNWTQEYVAERLHIDVKTVRCWEHSLHKPHPRLYRQLCLLFERAPDEGATTAEREQTFCEDDAYTQFQESDLTMRLLRIVLVWPRNGNARYRILQTLIAKELEEKDNTMQHINRRVALRRLASLPIELYGLSLLAPTFPKSYPYEDVLAQCAAGITACWYLRKSKDLAFADQAINRYLPTLKEIAIQGPAHLRKEAADLLAQSLLLKAVFVRHLNANYDASLRYTQQAEAYSEYAGNATLTAAALRHQASTYDYADNWPQAAQSALKAASLATTRGAPLPPIIQSFIYAGLANYQAHCGQKQEALRSLGKAQTAYYASEDNAVPWADHDEGGLLLHTGLAYYHLDMPKEAIPAFAQIASVATSETSRTEAFTDQVMTELSREDAPRDMEFCIEQWQQGVRKAIVMKSEQAFKESKTAYTAMRAAWPGEKRIKELREYIIH